MTGREGGRDLIIALYLLCGIEIMYWTYKCLFHNPVLENVGVKLLVLAVAVGTLREGGWESMPFTKQPISIADDIQAQHTNPKCYSEFLHHNYSLQIDFPDKHTDMSLTLSISSLVLSPFPSHISFTLFTLL